MRDKGRGKVRNREGRAPGREKWMVGTEGGC